MKLPRNDCGMLRRLERLVCIGAQKPMKITSRGKQVDTQILLVFLFLLKYSPYSVTLTRDLCSIGDM
jgi:hypothetical protein